MFDFFYLMNLLISKKIQLIFIEIKNVYLLKLERKILSVCVFARIFSRVENLYYLSFDVSAYLVTSVTPISLYFVST